MCIIDRWTKSCGGVALVVIFTLFFVLSLNITSDAAERPFVVFANPGGKDDVFFKLMTDFMQAAADDLGFELQVYYGDRNHVIFDDNVEAIFSQQRLPEYLIGLDARGSGVNLLKMAEVRGVKTIFINQGFLGKVHTEMGAPGEKYKYWLFEYLPDDIHSGYILAKVLIEEALAKGLVDADGLVNIIAVSGHETSSASILREKGLVKAVDENPQARLHQIVHAGWKSDKAKGLTVGLLKRYPDATVAWAASDKMALGVTEAIREVGKKPGVDVLTGGVDWANFALDMVQNGEFTVTVGGHFMDGAWGLVMLYDQIHGVNVPRSSQSHFSQITKKNVATYRKYFGDNNWSPIDFRKFSKHLNPRLKEYDFGLEAVLEQVQKQ